MYYNNNDVRLEELPLPQIGSGELLIKVMASGICGSDVMEWYRIHKAPLVLGHEIAGRVAAVGDKVTDYKVRDRVVVAHHVPCNSCHWCLSGHHTVCDTLRKTSFDPGGFSEFVRVPEINVKWGTFKIPETISYEEGTFVEPLACVLRGQRQAQIKKWQSVLVIGSGISGLLNIQMAKVNGAKKVFATDINEYRLKAAKRFGADNVIFASEDIPKKVKELNGGVAVDAVILCAGAESAIEQALRSVERAGTVLFFAPTRDDSTKIPLPVNELFWRNEITLTSSYAGSPADHIEAIRLIRSGRVKVKDMITDRLPLSETGRGFQLVADANESIKVIIEPQK